jgi:hypothetical protein
LAIGSGNASDDKIRELIKAITPTMAVQVQQTLPRIKDLKLQVMALRRYVRIGKSVTEKWTWTQEQYDDFNLTYAAVELKQSIEAVKAKFESDNLGYTLGTTSQFRPLDHQIENFCNSAEVSQAALILWIATSKEVDSYAKTIDAHAAGKFRQFLRNYQFNKDTEPSIAAPGISHHGRALAIDFVIYKNGRQVAGPSTKQIKSIWKDQGFDVKLNQAVKGSTNSFEPEHLPVPFEPWHYDIRKDWKPARWGAEGSFGSLA